MTNNQREFQKQINRLQREINSLIKRGVITTPPELPEQPKRITRAKLDEFKSLKGKDFIDLEEHKPRRSHKDDETHVRKVRPKNYVRPPYEPVDERATRSDKGTHRDTPSPLKGRPSPLKGRPSPLKGRPSPLKGTHLTAEERAKRNAKRLETIAKKSRPTTEEYAQPQTSYPEYNMVEWILDRLTQAKSVVIETQPMQSYGRQATRHSRVSYLDSLIQLVASNLQAEDYYNTIANREEQIASHIDTIVYASDQDDVDNSFTELYTLLSPDPVSLDELKRISEEAENYNDENYNG